MEMEDGGLGDRGVLSTYFLRSGGSSDGPGSAGVCEPQTAQLGPCWFPPLWPVAGTENI